MKTGYNKYIYILLLSGMVLTPFKGAHAQQIDDIGTIIKAGSNDASLLAREYLSPFAKGFGAGLNTGWFNTAKTHETFGFDITLNGSLALVPSRDQLFDVTELTPQFQRLEWDNTSPRETPTINGSDDVATSRFVIRENGLELDAFTMPEGTGLEFVPTPMIQASIGVVYNTDITVRFFPKFENEDFGKVKLFGLGLKHEINQWLPGGNALPVNLAVQAGFTNLDIDANLEVLPEAADSNPFPDSRWEGQKIVTSTNSFTVNAIVSKDLLFISLFGGAGFENATMELKTVGSYPVEVLDPNNPGQTTIESIEGEDLIDFEIDSDNSVHFTAGFTLKLSIVHLTASYTLADYQMAQASLGFSFR